MKDPKDRSENTKYYVSAAVLIVGLIVVLGLAYSPMSPIYKWWVTDDEPESPLPKATSTFTLYSAQDGEVVSDFVEMDIWVPKSGATFDEGYEDITALSLNFEREEISTDADDISLDLRDYDYIWAEVTGNDVFENTFYLLTGGANHDYGFYVHHTTSDVNFNILDDTMAALAYGDGWSADPYVKGVDANYTAVLNAPHLTKTNNHYGDNWDVSTDDFDDLILRDKEIVWNEIFWRDQYPVYDPTADTSNKYVRDWELLTNTFALKWTMNATINQTTGSTTQINTTIARGYPVEVWTTGAYLYMAWYEGFDFNPDPYALKFEMAFDTHINVTTVISCRVDVPASLSSIVLEETYSVIGA